MCPHPHRPTDLLNPLDHHVRQVRKKNLNNIMIATRRIMITPMRTRSLQRHTHTGANSITEVGQIQFSAVVDSSYEASKIA
jgi:hypothetical protein